MRVVPAVGLVTALLSSFLVSPIVHAADKQACVAASEAAQKLRAQKKLRAARKELLVCAQEDCPGVVKKDCLGWLNEVDASLPSVVISARGPAGGDLVDVRVLVDGEVLAEKLDGTALAIDPGLHTFRYEAKTGESLETQVLIKEGERNRSLTVDFGKPASAEPAPPPKSEPTPPSRSPSPAPVATSGGVPTAAYVLGAVGLVSLGGFAYFGLSGRADVRELRDTCAPYCNKDDETPARNKLLAADIALGVSVVSLGVATVLVLTAKPSERATTTTSLRVDVAPVANGAVGFIGGRF